jgi:hypothetical protein
MAVRIVSARISRLRRGSVWPERLVTYGLGALALALAALGVLGIAQ